MRYDAPKLQDVLAGQYVLGALPRLAQRRFEALMLTRPELRSRVAEWQDDLAPLDEETKAVEPSHNVLLALQQRLDPAQTKTNPLFWRKLAFWRPLGIIAAVLVMLLMGSTIYLSLPLSETEERVELVGQPRYVAVLLDKTETPTVVVTAYRSPFRLLVEPLESLAIPTDGTLRLWTVEQDSGATYPLASITSNTPFEQALSDQDWQRIKSSESLVVSQETADGEPAEEHPGSILYSGLCINLKGPPGT